MNKIKLIILIIINLIIIYKVIDIKIINYDYYLEEYNLKSNNIVYGQSPKRGRILDRNGNVLVDNKPIYNIYFRNINNKNINELLDIANNIKDILNIREEASEDKLKHFYIQTNDLSNYISEDEEKDYKYHKLSKEELYDKLYERVSINYSDEEKILINIYYLLTNGYKKDTKLIKENVSFDKCLSIDSLNIKGLECDISWIRESKYEFITSIVGSVGKIPEEEKDYYLNEGYLINDIVGISGLEKYYDSYLKGQKSTYQINKDNSLTIIKDEIIGNDLILSLDINLEIKSYEILKENFELAKTLDNTKYFKEAYILIGDPNTGQVLSVLGLTKDLKDISNLSMTSSYTLGSIIKGASHTVGYLNNLIDIGKKVKDSCVKVYGVPKKCSFKDLGYIDDIDALKMSSNYFQFITAIKSTGNKYSYNMNVKINDDNFNTYRKIFERFGLGSKTNIDYPNEQIGIKGSKVSLDLLLNYSIGQYDTYTPMQILSYINTIAMRGIRYNLSFKYQDNDIASIVNLDEKYMDRIIQGLYKVVNEGTGRGYSDKSINAAGKTGTAQNVVDKNLMTINSSYVMFAPMSNPKYSVVVITPSVSYYNNNEYIAPINRLISKSITNYLFSNY